MTEDVKSKAGKLSTGVIDHEDFNKVGLFEAARLASPCIPQFHPKLLLELLNFGKVGEDGGGGGWCGWVEDGGEWWHGVVVVDVVDGGKM